MAIIAFQHEPDRDEAETLLTASFNEWQIQPITKLRDRDCTPNSQHVAYIRSEDASIEELNQAEPGPFRRFTKNNDHVTISFFSKEDLTTFVNRKTIKFGNTDTPISLSFLGKTEIKLILRKLPAYSKVRMVKRWLSVANVKFESVELPLDSQGGPRGFAWVHFSSLPDKIEALDRRVFTSEGKRLEWGNPSNDYPKPRKRRHDSP